MAFFRYPGCRHIVFLFSLVMPSASAVYAAESNSAEAKRIYDRARRVEKTFTFTASIPIPKRTATVFVQANPDGTAYRKSEYSGGNYGTTTFLDNASGAYTIEGRTAVKRLFPMGIHVPEYDDYHASYSVTEGKHQNIPCHVVKKETPDNEATFAGFLRHFPADEKKGRSETDLRVMFLSAFSPIIVYHIGKDNGFIYSERHYSSSGKLKRSFAYADVKFFERLPDGTFDLPRDVKVLLARNIDEYSEKTLIGMREDYDARHGGARKRKSPEGWLTLIGGYFRRNLDAIVSGATWFFISSGIASLALVIHFKRRPKQAPDRKTLSRHHSN